LIGTRTESDNGTEGSVTYLLIELRIPDTCLRKNLLEDIAGITAQLTPIHNQTKRFRLVVSVIDEDIPFYSIGLARHPADRDILEGIIEGIIARNTKLRGDLAVDTLKKNFVIDTDKYIIIQKYEKFEVTRKGLTTQCTRASKELAALWKSAAATRTRRWDLTAEILDACYLEFRPSWRARAFLRRFSGFWAVFKGYRLDARLSISLMETAIAFRLARSLTFVHTTSRF
jgi:hypothetical protein